MNQETIGKAVDALRSAAAAPGTDGSYFACMPFDTAQDLVLWALFDENRNVYRERELARSLMRHERKRADLGRRADRPTAAEVAARALRLDN